MRISSLYGLTKFAWQQTHARGPLRELVALPLHFAWIPERFKGRQIIGGFVALDTQLGLLRSAPRFFEMGKRKFCWLAVYGTMIPKEFAPLPLARPNMGCRNCPSRARYVMRNC